MSKPRFILTRFTHGSAGKFLSTVLQTSDKIDHWSAIIQQHKNTTLGDKLTLEYTNRSFPMEKSRHLTSEPMVPYNTDLYSTSFPRGNDVNIDQYTENAKVKNDFRLLNNINSGKLSNLIFNKPIVPFFCQYANVVTIIVTTSDEKEWLFKSLWSKHFLETPTEIRYLPADPAHCSLQSLPAILTFNNQYCFPVENKPKLYHDYVINNSTNDWYFNPRKFIKHDKLAQLNNTFINLDELLVTTKFLYAVTRIFEFHKLGTPNIDLIQQMHQIWLSRQFPYEL